MTAPMRLDSGNRSFLLLVGITTALRTTVMVLACCVFCMVPPWLATTGPAVLWAGGGWILPAVLLAGLIIAATMSLILRAVRELRADSRLRRRLRTHTAEPDYRLREVAARHGLAGRLRVVEEDTEMYAFTYGFVAPTVVVSGALVRTLGDDELTAVLAHESAHVRGRDPLKVLIARLVVSHEFYLPVLRHLSARFVGGRELAADRHALAVCGVRPLAGALLRVLDPPNWAAATPAAAMASTATMDARIRQLETGTEPTSPAPPYGQTLASVIAGVLVVAAAVDAAVVVQQLCMRAM